MSFDDACENLKMEGQPNGHVVRCSECSAVSSFPAYIPHSKECATGVRLKMGLLTGD